MKFNHMRVLSFLLGAIVLALCLTNCTVQKQVEAVSKTEPTAASTPAKVTLNNEPHGTTADTTPLLRRLKDVFKEREENGVFKKDSFEIEKKVFLTGEPSARAEHFIKVFSAISKAGGAPIEIPLKAKKTILKPNPLTLVVYVGEKKPSELLEIGNGMEISFVGQMRQKDNKFPLGETAILMAADKAGGYTLNGKKVLPNALITELQNRFRGKAKGNKTVFAEIGSDSNYGFMEEIARVAFDAGVKVYFVTENSNFNGHDITFSLSQAWFKDDEVAVGTDEDKFGSEIVFRGPDFSQLTIYIDNELKEINPSVEVKGSYEAMLKEIGKEYFKELKIAEIDGMPGVLSKVENDDYGRILWVGYRKKDGKFQYISISLSSPASEFRHRRYEFLNILNSIKFTGN